MQNEICNTVNVTVENIYTFMNHKECKVKPEPNHCNICNAKPEPNHCKGN